MSCSDVIFAIISVIVAIVVGRGQIRIAQSVKDFDVRQDARDEQRRKEYLYAEATKFIQKYNCLNMKSEIYLLPLCVTAYKYDPVYPYRREIYREFCSLQEDVQNEILKRCNIDTKSEGYKNYFRDMLTKIVDTIKVNYPDDSVDRYFYDNGKYLKLALTDCGTEPVPDGLQCEIDKYEEQARKTQIGKIFKSKDNQMDFKEHLTNLLAYHKGEKPLESMLEYFRQADKVVTSYMCCEIAKYAVIYSYEDMEREENMAIGHVDDYCGERCMEDAFLEALYTAEYYYKKKE